MDTRNQRLSGRKCVQSGNFIESTLFSKFKGTDLIILYYRVKDRNVILFQGGSSLFKI